MGILGRLLTSISTVVKKTSVVRTGQLLSSYLIGRPFYHPEWTADTAQRDGLEASPWVYACIKSYTDAIQSIELKVQVWDEEADQWINDNKHELNDILDQPNPRMSGKIVLTRNLADILLSGNFINTIIDSDTDKNRTLEYWPIPSDNVQPIPDEIALIRGYRFSKWGFLTGGSRVLGSDTGAELDAEFVVHGQLIDPRNPVWGLSPLKAAALIIDTEVASQQWNRSMLKNRAIGSGAYITDQFLSTEQYNIIRKQILDQHQGPDNAYQPWLLSGGAKWSDFSKSAIDMDFANLKKMSAKEICACLKVAPPLVGLSEDATLANLTEYKKMFWQDAIIPHVTVILDAWNRQWIWPRHGNAVRIWYDTANVIALQDSRSDRIKDAKEMFDMMVPVEVLNRLFDLGIPEGIPGLNVGWGDPKKVAITEEFMADPMQVVMQPTATAATTATTPVGSAQPKKMKNQSWENSMELIRKALWDEEFDRYKHLLQDDLKFVITDRNGIDVGIKNLSNRVGHWELALTRTWKKCLTLAGERNYKQLAASGHFNSWSTEIEDFVKPSIKRRASAIVSFTQTQLRSLHETVKETAALTSDWKTLVNTRVSSICGYEVNAATSFGSYQAAKQSGKSLKRRWIVHDIECARDSHVAMSGEVRGLNEPYSNGCLYPGDPNGPIAEVIGCQCTEEFFEVEAEV